ncbi:hypothetical protein UFOVP250_8 [uncultured Caudovirales phage]|uniref:Uncharacterized protein n=1 Tax=uncultured Caudovirales phage TaxID=2100421 RepID=A0A6J5LIT5_9CAUD|nr:hypothetical protein UFOVP250_8 [uncultured Caudovirales phage]
MSYTYNTGLTQTIPTTYTYTANITGYDANTKIATLDAPVDFSLGYNSVVGPVSSQYTIVGNITNVSKAIQAGNSLPQMSTDESGNFVGIFNVPPGVFQTGSRVFRVDNRSVSTDPGTATTYAEATFTASGLSATAQKLQFAPSIDSSDTTFTQVNEEAKKLIRTIKTESPWDPIAQTFIIDKNNFPNGAFLNSIKVFFATKPTTTNDAVTLSIVGTLNGYPNGKTLDYSKVTLNANQVIASAKPYYLDASTYTEFVFSAPVYIQADTLYAFMLQTNNSAYSVYYAQQNSTAIASSVGANTASANTTTTKIGSAPYVGALFESQNGITWTADQTKDLMFVIDRCVFDTSKTPQVQFVVPKGLPFRKFGQHDIQFKLDSNNVTNLFGNLSESLPSDAYNLTTTDFIPTSTSVDYGYQATLLNTGSLGAIAPASPGKLGSPTFDNIYLNDGQGERYLDKNSNNSFILYATMVSNDANVSPIIADDGVSLYNIRNVINNMGIFNNVISVANTGSGYYNQNTLSAVISSPNVGGSSAVLGVKANTQSGQISSVYVISPGAGYITNPTITIVDANTTPGTGATISVIGETSSTGGNSFAKYFTKKVVLAPGNDSGDLRVYYTAYKPAGSDVYVYYKILSGNDSQPFESGTWQLMTQTTNTNTYSSSRTDLIEYEYAPGLFGSGNANNNISYVSSNGQTYTSFIQFAIKVVFASSDPTNVPFLADIRALALPSGTGI